MREKFQLLYRQLIFKCKDSKNRIYLYVISFLESIVFPLPTDIFLIPFILAEKKKLLASCLNDDYFFGLGRMLFLSSWIISMGTGKSFFPRILPIN